MDEFGSVYYSFDLKKGGGGNFGMIFSHRERNYSKKKKRRTEKMGAVDLVKDGLGVPVYFVSFFLY